MSGNLNLMPHAPETEAEQLERRLDVARAERNGRELAKSEAVRLAKLRDETEAEERALAEEKVVDELVEKFGPVDRAIAVVQTPEGMIVVKKPNHLLFKKFADKETTKSDDLDQLVRPCLLHPSKTEFDRICEASPAALFKAANAVSALAGFRKEDLAKK